MTTKSLQNIAAANTMDTSKKVRKALTLVLTLTLVFAMMCVVAGASGAAASGIESGVKQGLGQIYRILTSIVVPVAVVCLAFAAYQVFTGGERGMESAKKIILYTVIGVGIVYLAPLIIQEVGGWFSTTSESSRADVFGT